MEKSNKNKLPRGEKSQSHMPDDSVFYEKFVPVMLVGLAILTLIIILVAAGIATGLIPY